MQGQARMTPPGASESVTVSFYRDGLWFGASASPFGPLSLVSSATPLSTGSVSGLFRLSFRRLQRRNSLVLNNIDKTRRLRRRAKTRLLRRPASSACRWGGTGAFA